MARLSLTNNASVLGIAWKRFFFIVNETVE